MSLCRICLDNGATFPLFENSESEDCNLLSRLTMCLKEKIEDIEGYPRYICKSCKDTIEIMCNFITKYKESTIVLASRIPDLKDDNYFSDRGEIEIAIDNIKYELQSDDDNFANDSDNADESLPLIQLKLKDEIKSEIKIEHDPKPVKIKRKGRKGLTIRAKSTKNDINKIASSILEGDFAWIGDVWCIKSTKPVVKKEKPIKQPERRKVLKIPKKPKEPKPPPAKLCDLCGEIFKDQDKLSSHKRKVHYKKPMKCPHCPRLLASNYYLKRHLKRKHESNGKTFLCTLCDKAFAFKGELTTHNRNVHNKHLKPRKMYSCKICDKTYKCAKSVQIHERSVHTGLRPAVCDICGSSFYDEGYLKEHRRLHTGETPFKCPVCGRGYAQRGNMKSHLRIHRISELDALTLSKLKPNYLKLLKVS